MQKTKKVVTAPQDKEFSANELLLELKGQYSLLQVNTNINSFANILLQLQNVIKTQSEQIHQLERRLVALETSHPKNVSLPRTSSSPCLFIDNSKPFITKDNGRAEELKPLPAPASNTSLGTSLK